MTHQFFQIQQNCTRISKFNFPRVPIILRRSNYLQISDGISYFGHATLEGGTFLTSLFEPRTNICSFFHSMLYPCSPAQSVLCFEWLWSLAYDHYGKCCRVDWEHLLHTPGGPFIWLPEIDYVFEGDLRLSSRTSGMLSCLAVFI